MNKYRMLRPELKSQFEVTIGEANVNGNSA